MDSLENANYGKNKMEIVILSDVTTSNTDIEKGKPEFKDCGINEVVEAAQEKPKGNCCNITEETKNIPHQPTDKETKQIPPTVPDKEVEDITHSATNEKENYCRIVDVEEAKVTDELAKNIQHSATNHKENYCRIEGIEEDKANEEVKHVPYTPAGGADVTEKFSKKSYNMSKEVIKSYGNAGSLFNKAQIEKIDILIDQQENISFPNRPRSYSC